jgi:Fe-S-cluster-containing hydrogenase component 2
MAVCPFGAMDFDGEVRKVVKCNLCDGDPLCAELCSYGALQYLCIMEQSILKKMEVADKIKGILSNRKADKGD